MNTPGEIVDFNLAEGWKLAPLEDLFDILRNATSSRAEYSADGQVACVHYGDIHVKWNCFLDFASEQVPGVSEAKARSIPRLRDGDLVVVDTSEDDVALGKCVEVRNLGDREAVSRAPHASAPTEGRTAGGGIQELRIREFNHKETSACACGRDQGLLPDSSSCQEHSGPPSSQC